MAEEYLSIKFRDGSINKAAIFRGREYAGTTFVCLPAMGVRAKYYHVLALRLQQAGYNVLVPDWRGLGNSDVRASRKSDFGYKDLIDDLSEWIFLLNKEFSGIKKILIGHSLGGQIGSLYCARFPDQCAALILIASSLVHYRGWAGFNAAKIKFAGYVFPVLAQVAGYFPGRLIGFGGREAKSVITDWSYNALTGSYSTIDPHFNYELALKKLKIPVLAFNIENDFFASKEATKRLYQKFNKEAAITHSVVTSEEAGIKELDHFNWVKEPEYFVAKIRQWLYAIEV